MTLATYAFGPVADNAGDISEMAEFDKFVRDTTTGSTGKGFALESVVLTLANLDIIAISSSEVLCLQFRAYKLLDQRGAHGYMYSEQSARLRRQALPPRVALHQNVHGIPNLKHEYTAQVREQRCMAVKRPLFRWKQQSRRAEAESKSVREQFEANRVKLSKRGKTLRLKRKGTGTVKPSHLSDAERTHHPGQGAQGGVVRQA